MKEIILKHGQRVLVDDEDYDYLTQFTWHGGKYVTRPNWIIKGVVRGFPSRIRMHREVMKCTDPNLEVDHINHNGLDNRKSNLRVCSSGQNTCNRKPRKDKKDSKYLGVHKTSNGYWFSRASKLINGERKYITSGPFLTEVEAALAYNDSAKILHGEFANPNIISQ